MGLSCHQLEATHHSHLKPSEDVLNLSYNLEDDMMIVFDSPYQTRQQIEKLFQISRPTIYRWIKEGKFPRPVHLGANMVRWKTSHLETWMADKESTNLRGGSNAQS
jgi:prophage regulatory protein